ncbi:MAG TPA: hypothetical protein VGE68_00975 [Sphingomicrobium sp.]
MLRLLVLRAVPPVLALRPLLAARVPVERLADVPVDFARVDVDLRVLEVARLAAGLRPPVERDPVERERPELELDELSDPLSSSVHLPDRTRCAASATASAISEPSFDAFETTELAAACALSAASRPASRILRRAAGLALIAAAAAASPAASISRLIAALASLSKVSFPLPFFVLDFAIAESPSLVAAKDKSDAQRFRFAHEQSGPFPKNSNVQIR